MQIMRTTITITCDEPATAGADPDPRNAVTIDELVWFAENGRVTFTTEVVDVDEL